MNTDGSTDDNDNDDNEALSLINVQVYIDNGDAIDDIEDDNDDDDYEALSFIKKEKNVLKKYIFGPPRNVNF